MKTYITYHVGTGRIVSRKRLARGNPLPPQGPCDLPGMEGLAILHCDADPDQDRVEHGRVVPIGLQKRRATERHLDWMTFRRARAQKLAETDHMMMPDYPLSQADRRALKAKRKASRDIPQKTTNPHLALQMLETLWREN